MAWRLMYAISFVCLPSSSWFLPCTLSTLFNRKMLIPMVRMCIAASPGFTRHRRTPYSRELRKEAIKTGMEVTELRMANSFLRTFQIFPTSFWVSCLSRSS